MKTTNETQKINGKKEAQPANYPRRHALFHLLFALVGLVLLLCGAYYSYRTVENALVESEAESLKSLASANAINLKAEFRDKEELLLSLYADEFESMEALNTELDKVFCDKLFYRPSDYERLPAWKRDICLRAAKAPGTVISGPCVYQNGGYYVFYMTLSVSVAGEPAGVLQFEWNLDRIFRQTETLSSLHINNNGYCIVRNKEGKIVMSAEQGKEDIADTTFPEAAGNTLPAVQKTWHYELVNGAPVQQNELLAFASAAVGDEVFTVYVAEDYDMLVKPIEKLSIYLAFLGGLLLIWLLASMWLYMQSRKKEEQLRLALRYEKELNEAGKTLEKQEEILRIYNRDKELTALQSSLAHEFNNQMTPVLIYAELFRDNKTVAGLLPEETEALYQSALQCSDLSRQMLEFTRQGRAEKKAVDFNASMEVRTSLRMVEKLLPEHVRMETKLSRREFFIHGQSGMLSQIILNLSNNAVYAMRETQDAVLRVMFGASKEQEGFICLIIEDNGCGIPKAQQRHVFEPFFTTKPMKEGNGIGLTVVARLVQEHGGFLDVKSEEGRGTSFTIQIPYIRVEEAEKI
ncbi:MAG: ATP-binding protein [Eubacteriales bacterium]|nr:ATP-binding protein [Eubacteriales bacterium]